MSRAEGQFLLLSHLFKIKDRRILQFYAALCLKEYSQAICVKSEELDELIKHLMRILVAESLPEWEQRGGLLSLTGRGDQLPTTIQSQLSPNEQKSFPAVLELSVEVGLADMYGRPSDVPEHALQTVLGILSAENVALPDWKSESTFSRFQVHWGPPMSEREFKGIVSKYDLGNLFS